MSDQIAVALEGLGVKVEIVNPSTKEASVIRRYDAEKGTLTLSARLLEQRLKFQLAHTIGLRLLDGNPRLAPEMSAFRARHAETPRLVKIHLANYFAGALLLPYDDFFREVNRTRYDIELLSDLFEMSYEAVAHRTCNLADPKRRGIPMHFLRSDIGGNISKRYAATGIRFPTGTGSCPKWAVHMAFLTPGVITKQYSIFPDGSRYFCFAKVILQPEAGSVMKGTVYGIGLGTHADAAKHLAYADGMPIPEDFDRVAVPVGISCRFCERTDCSQRAAPSYKFAFAVDEYVKKDNVFSPMQARTASAARAAGGGPDPKTELVAAPEARRRMKRSLPSAGRSRARALEDVRRRCDVAARLERDPVGVVRRYSQARDREIVGLLAASIAFGNVATIRAKLDDALARLGPRPARPRRRRAGGTRGDARVGPPRVSRRGHRPARRRREVGAEGRGVARGGVRR